MPINTRHPLVTQDLPRLNEDAAKMIAQALVVFFAQNVPRQRDIFRDGPIQKKCLVTYILCLQRVTRDPEFIHDLCNHMRRWLVLYTRPCDIRSQAVKRSVATFMYPHHFLTLRNVLENHDNIYSKLRAISASPLAFVSVRIKGEEMEVWQLVNKITIACGQIAPEFSIDGYLREIFDALRANIDENGAINSLQDLSLAPVDEVPVTDLNTLINGVRQNSAFRPCIYNRLVDVVSENLVHKVIPDAQFKQLGIYLDKFLEALQPFTEWHADLESFAEAKQKRKYILDTSFLCGMSTGFILLMVYIGGVMMGVLKMSPKIVMPIIGTLTLCYCFYMMISLCRKLKGIPPTLFKSGKDATLNLAARMSRLMGDNAGDRFTDLTESLLAETTV